MDPSFLVDTYDTERLKTLTVWSSFRDADLPVRPSASDARGRSVREQMVHQCVSEDHWFVNVLGVDVGAPPLPEEETRLAFLERYAADSGRRAEELSRKDEAWWSGEVAFFEVRRSRGWVLVRRIAHSAHHRGQLTALLRVLGREVYSTYGPTADTGGLMRDRAPTLYAYGSVAELLEGERAGGRRRPLPGPGERPPTERPDRSPAGAGPAEGSP